MTPQPANDSVAMGNVATGNSALVKSAMASDDPVPTISVISGNPTRSELAAITAVLAATLEEIDEKSQRDGATRTSAWQRSQRAIRVPLSPGYGAWRGF